MMRFVAMLRDSLKEAVDGWIFLVMLGLSTLLIVLVASASVRPLPAASAVPDMLPHQAMQMVFADRGQASRAAMFMQSQSVENVATLEKGGTPWDCDIQFTLRFQRGFPGMPAGIEMEGGKDLKDVKRGDIKIVEGQAGLFADPIEDAARFWAASAGTPAKERPKFTEELASDFLAYQVAAASGLKVIKVVRKEKGVYEITARSESRLRWPHEPSLFFGSLKLPFARGPLGDILYNLESGLVSGLGAWVVMLAGVIVTAGFVPNMLRKGAIDLLLTKPMSRPLILVYKYLGGLTFVALLTTITTVGIWAAVGMRTNVWFPGLLVASVPIVFYFAILYAFSTLVGVLTRNSIVCIVATFLFWIAIFLIGTAHSVVSELDRVDMNLAGAAPPGGDGPPDLKPPGWAVTTTTVLNRITPRTRDLGTLTDRVIGSGLLSDGEQERQRKKTMNVDWPEVIGVSLGYLGAFLALAVLRFVTRSY